MSNRNIIYSGHPLAIANLQLEAEEFQHVVYMPIRSKPTYGSRFMPLVSIPDGLMWAYPAVAAVMDHLKGYRCPDLLTDWYVYLTVKRSWVEAGTAGNREGWHIDGYGSNGDKNFIWCDSVPAEVLKGTFSLPTDHAECLSRLEYLGSKAGTHHLSHHCLEPFQLYDLGQSVHRCATAKVSGMRTFLKVSVSRDKYDLKGNARNPLLPSTHWPLKDRQGTRNHPTAQPGNGRATAYRAAEESLESFVVPHGMARMEDNRGLDAVKVGDPAEFCRCRNNLECITTKCGQEYEIATHGIHKGTQIAQTGTEQLHNEGSLS